MTNRSALLPYACALVVLSLCAPMVAMAPPAVNGHSPAGFRALAAPSSIVLLTRCHARQDHPRPSTPFLLIAVPLGGREPDLVRLAAASKRFAPRRLFTP